MPALLKRLAWAGAVFVLAAVLMAAGVGLDVLGPKDNMTNAQLFARVLALPAALALVVFAFAGPAQAREPDQDRVTPTAATAATAIATATTAATATAPARPGDGQPFMAQVVGLQWLNPLHRMDYPTEWQLLWTLGLVRPNKDDDMVKTEPELFSTLQKVAAIATRSTENGVPSLSGFHEKYLRRLTSPLHDPYFANPEYFYNAHRKDRRGWRELAGIHVQYALPAGRLDGDEAAKALREELVNLFNIGNIHSPTTWSRATPPDIRVTLGGANAGFTSLAAALAYLEQHPDETAWAMNWDAPSYPDYGLINENMVLLVLAGPHYPTGRAPLAWVGRPASRPAAEFEAKKAEPRVAQAWRAVLQEAARNAGSDETRIGYAIHDAGGSAGRLGDLAQVLGAEVPDFDFLAQTFDTPAQLGEMGEGTALTNVALAVGYANHVGRAVVVAGTSEPQRPTAVVVVPPATVRPIDPAEDWFRARGGNHAHLMWWGLRHDANPQYQQQGFSK